MECVPAIQATLEEAVVSVPMAILVMILDAKVSELFISKDTHACI